MKFGNTLKTLSEEGGEYGYHYVQYTFLKKYLKEIKKGDADSTFIQLVGKELERVKSIITNRLEEIRLSCGSLETSVKLLATSEAQSEACSFHNVQSSADLLAHRLAETQKIIYFNKEGFRKILKKHDKIVGVPSVWYMAHGHPRFFVNALMETESMLLKISDIYHFIRTNSNKQAQDAGPGISGTVFERSTSKYWVSNEETFHLKSELIKHLPIHVFQRQKKADNTISSPQDIILNEPEDEDSIKDIGKTGWISSVYLDNMKMDCYNTRMKMEEGATLLRVRWYGDPSGIRQKGESTELPRPPPSDVYFERKTHHESWVDKKSVKERFPIAEEDISHFLTGGGDVDALKQTYSGHLSKEIKEEVEKRSLTPMVRTVYQRTSFQLDDNNEVRLTLDSNMIFVNEHPDLRKPTEWRRQENTVEQSADWVTFPYAILEVKLKTAEPEWLASILALPGVREVKKFSKFQHGCASYHSDLIKQFPYWYEETDINQAVKRCSQKKKIKDVVSYTNPAFEMEKTVSASPVSAGLAPSAQANGTELNHRKTSTGSRQRGPARKTKAGGCLTPCWTPRKEKKKSLATKRVKVEPKTFFANERTFIQWITSVTLLVTVGTALLAFAKNNPGLQYMSWALMFSSVIILIYAVVMFYVRLHRIKRRDTNRYDDWFGPALLATCLMTAVVVSIYIQIYEGIKAPAPINVLVESQQCVRQKVDIPPFFEPSDLTWGESSQETLWSCSANRFINFDVATGKILDSFTVEEGQSDCISDIEALLVIPNNPPNKTFIMLDEKKDTLILFDQQMRRKTHVIKIEGSLTSDKHDLDGDGDLESLAYYPGYLTARSRGNANIIGNGTFFLNTRTKILAFILERVGINVVPYRQFQFKVGDSVRAMAVHKEHLFLVFDNKRKLEVLNLKSGKVVKTFPLPGDTKGWEGIAIKQSTTGAYLRVFLADDSHGQVWEFRFTMQGGFQSCV